MARSASKNNKIKFITRLRAAMHIFNSSGSWSPQTIDDLDRWMDATAAGNSAAAMNYTAYFSGVMQIAQSLASVKFPLLKHDGPMRRKPWIEHPVYNMLNRMANPWVNAMKFREIMQMQVINWGDAFAFLTRDKYYRPEAAYVLDPQRMRVDIKDSGEQIYIYRSKNGEEKIYSNIQIFHLSGFGPDAYTGYSMIGLFSEALKLGLSQQKFMNNFIEKGVHTSGVVTHPDTLSVEAKLRLREDIQDSYSGTNNAGRVLVFEEGMTWQTFSMPLKDAELLGSRVFQIQEIARILNMPPHKLKDLANATFSNIEHQQIEWITDTLRPWAERWEIAVDTQLLTPIERKKGYAQHDLNQLTRGDMKTMMETQRIGRFAGLLTTDEARYNIGMNPAENDVIGRRMWQPSNMMDASSIAAAGGGGDAGGMGGTE